MMTRQLNHEIAALRAISAQILSAAIAPDAPGPLSGSGLGDGSSAEPTPRSFPTESGDTLYQMFTELDGTEGNAASM